MGHKQRPLKQGLFRYNDLTVEFGSPLSKTNYQFTARAIKVPDYKYQVYEAEDAGGGWYGPKQWVTKTATRVFIIIRDHKCIGWMNDPYHGEKNGIKTMLIPIGEKTPAEVRDFVTKTGFIVDNYVYQQ